MSRPTKRQALIKAARQEGGFTRVQVTRVTCPRCQQDGLLAMPDGVTPRPHLRPTRPGEPLYSAIVPTRIDCEE